MSALVCDAPAKSFVLYLKGHTGYNSCTKCCIEGKYSRPKKSKIKKKKNGRICFPGIGPFTMKTDEKFHSNCYNDFDEGNETILKRIPQFGGITSVPLDYMHLILLGVMKKLITLWLTGPLKTRLSASKVDQISKKLLILRRSMPSEFGRKPRSLFEFRHWKATEFRTFLVYAGPVVLKKILPKKQYDNFILLHSAVTLLLSELHIMAPENIDCAQEMLEHFVIGFAEIYGEQFVSHNVHNLLHICSDVKKYGILDKYSAFRFENYMTTVKRMVRKGEKPLEQIARRYSEHEAVEKYSEIQKGPSYKHIHNTGPIPRDLKNIWQQYKLVNHESYTIDCSNAKNSFILLKDGTFGKVLNIINCNDNECQLVVKKLSSTDKLYEYPNSQLLNIHITKICNEVFLTSINNNVLCKVWRVPTREGIICLPLLH